MADVVIYALYDRDNLAIRYVGQTADLGSRLWHHRNPAPTARGPVVEWARGRDFGHLVLSRVDAASADGVERVWIAHFRQDHADLLNVEDGGRGGATGRVARASSWTDNTAPRGTGHARARFTEDNVREIRRRAAAGETNASIAARFGCSVPAVSSIRTRRTWKHLP